MAAIQIDLNLVLFGQHFRGHLDIGACHANVSLLLCIISVVDVIDSDNMKYQVQCCDQARSLDVKSTKGAELEYVFRQLWLPEQTI